MERLATNNCLQIEWEGSYNESAYRKRFHYTIIGAACQVDLDEHPEVTLVGAFSSED
jgi:hypothetical protein